MTVAHDYDLSLFAPPGQTVEVRALHPGGVSRAGYVRAACPRSMLAIHVRDQLKAAGAEGVYFTPHGRTPVAMPSPNAGAWARGAKPLTSDADIPARRYLLIDCDRRKTPATAQLSATDAEKAAAGELATRVLDTMAGIGWASPLKIDSGNGYHLYYRLSAHQPGGKVADPLADPLALLLRVLADPLNTDAAEIDTRVFNSSRIMKVPGTWARKGPNTPDRPHRVCRVLNVPDGWNPGECDPAADVLRAVESLDPGGVIRAGWRVSSSAAGATSASTSTHAATGDRTTDRATAYVRSLPASIQGANGSAKLYAAATALVHGFDLPTSTARDILHAHFNPRCEPAWSDAEIDRKLSEAATKDHREPRGWLRDRDQGTGIPEAPAYLPDYCGPVSATSTPPTPPGGGAIATDAMPPGDDGEGVFEHTDDPHRLARLVLAGYRRPHWPRVGLVYWQRQFHAYTGRGYDARDADDFNKSLNRTIHTILSTEHKAHAKKLREENKADEIQPITRVTPTLTNSVEAALGGRCRVPGLDTAPAWLGSWHGRPDPSHVVPVANGLAYLPAYAAGDPAGLIPHTPEYFAPPAASYRADRDAPPPANWLAFLAELWPDDPEAIGLLQEWCGYLLTADIHLQKMLLMVGPPRCGKGTILQVLTALVGEGATAATSINSLGGPFGLQPLLGKRLATIGDARVSGKTDLTVAVERLLSISSGDNQTVNRKGKDEGSAQLRVRIVLASNEVPRLPDSSTALANRWSVLRFTKSFLGREDARLFTGKLKPELGSIFNWAAEGWARLNARGRLPVIESGAEVTADLMAAGSPVAEFVADRCDHTDPSKTVMAGALYTAWKDWCEQNGRQQAGTADTFGRALRSYLPTVHRSRVREGGQRVYQYAGIRLLPEIPGYSPPDDRLAHETREPEPVRQPTIGEDL